jgi:hypothetical protein
MFRDGGEDMDSKSIGLRKIDGFKLNPGFHKVRNERHVSGKPIKLGNDQNRPVETAGGKGFRKPWAVVSFAAFDLDVFG